MPTEIPGEATVQFRSDGLGLSPAAYLRLLAEIAETRGIAEDNYSRDGVVAELEARIAALLGKEAAVFMPTGTLANHLALRLLARNGRRVVVQRRSRPAAQALRSRRRWRRSWARRRLASRCRSA